MAIATKKIKHDIYDGEVAIRPRAFVVSGAGEFVDVPTFPVPPDFDGQQADYYRYVATSSNAPFLPPIGGKKRVGSNYQYGKGNSINASPGINPYSYRRIPFVHKIGGSNQISTIGNAQISEEILRYNLYGKDGDNAKLEWQTPFSAATIQFIVFPFGRSAPLGDENNSFQAADNFVHPRGNLSPTTYFRQRLTFVPVPPSQSPSTITLWSGSGEIDGTYTPVTINATLRNPISYIVSTKPDVIFNNSPAAINDLAANPLVGSAGTNDNYASLNPSDIIGEGNGGFGFNVGFNNLTLPHKSLFEVYPEGHAHAGKARFYETTIYNPTVGTYASADGNGPIPNPNGNLNSGVYPVNKYVGTNTWTDPNTPNSLSPPWFSMGHQGPTQNGDISLNFGGRSVSSGLIIKGLIELY